MSIHIHTYSFLLRHLEPALEFVRTSCVAGTETNDANLLMSFFRMLEASFVPEKGVGVKGQTDEAKQVYMYTYIYIYIYICMYV